MMEIEARAAPDGAVCGKHPERVAVITCGRCGDFCCEPCIRARADAALCIGCWERTGGAQRIVNPLGQLWMLPLHPDRFFAPQVRFNGWATALVAYVVGVSGSIQRAEQQAWKDSVAAAARGAAVETKPVLWSALWMSAAVAGVFSGLIYYYVGGFWYGLRLRWSGVSGADARGVRELNSFSELPMELLYLLAVAVEGAFFASFDQVRLPWQSSTVVNALGLVVVYTSFVGVRARYGLAGVPGMLWFLVLPALRCLAGMIVGYWSATGSLTTFLRQLSSP